MIRGRTALAISAVLIALSACGTTAHSPAVKTVSSGPSPVSNSDLLLTKADLPPGFIEFTPKAKPRPFCGDTKRVQPTTRVRANFALPSGSNVYEIRDVIATYSSTSQAQTSLEEVRSLLRTSCHTDRTPHGLLRLSEIATPPLGGVSLGVRQEAPEVLSTARARLGSLVAYAYYVLAGSSIIEVEIADAHLLGGQAGVTTTASDLTLLKKLTLLQLKRFNSKTPAPGLAA